MRVDIAAPDGVSASSRQRLKVSKMAPFLARYRPAGGSAGLAVSATLITATATATAATCSRRTTGQQSQAANEPASVHAPRTCTVAILAVFGRSIGVASSVLSGVGVPR